ncbi:hypothetical protein OIO90_004559 [Microbotryomycetes sp. JL221]|nr:hypothetical protein OIO90_004559 [Microbotryomycetes sp. JL221]
MALSKSSSSRSLALSSSSSSVSGLHGQVGGGPVVNGGTVHVPLQPIAEEVSTASIQPGENGSNRRRPTSQRTTSASASSQLLTDSSNLLSRGSSLNIKRKPPPSPDPAHELAVVADSVSQQSQEILRDDNAGREGIAAKAEPSTSKNPTATRRKKQQRTRDELLMFDEAKSLYQAGVESAKKKSGQLGALPLFRQAYNVFNELGCPSQAKKSLWKVAMTLGAIGHRSFQAKRYEEALNMFSEARALFRFVGEKSKEAMALFQSGLVYVALRETEQAILLIKEAARLFVELADEADEAMCLCELASILKKQDPSASITYFKQALLIYLRSRDSFREAKTLCAIGLLSVSTKDYAGAYAYLKQARVIFRKRSDSQNLAQCSYQLGKLYNKASELNLAVECFEEAARGFHLDRKYVDEGWCYYRLGLAMLKAKDRSTAADYLTEARQLFKETSERQAEASCLMRLGEIIRDVDKEGAKECWQQVLQLVGQDKSYDRRVRRVSMWLDKLDLQQDRSSASRDGDNFLSTMNEQQFWGSPLTDGGEEAADESDRKRYREQEIEGEAAWWSTRGREGF